MKKNLSQNDISEIQEAINGNSPYAAVTVDYEYPSTGGYNGYGAIRRQNIHVKDNRISILREKKSGGNMVPILDEPVSIIEDVIHYVEKSHSL